jgi:hypothetical protein
MNVKKRRKKSALLQNKRWELRWLFANVLMRVGKKAVEKKNKFCGGSVFIFIFRPFFLYILFGKHSI